MTTTYSLDLLFLDVPLFDADGPREQLARVFVKTKTGAHYRGINDLDFITPECVASGEFDYQIDRLKDELETIRKRAHRAFAKAREGRRTASPETH